MQQSLISIIVPVYNAEQYLEKCLDSILAQTYSELEIILVDDGSTDTSGTICDAYAARDSRIIVHHQKNTGQAGARNYGLDIAKGEYIGFVDSDDWVAPEMYETMLACLLRHQADVVVCSRFSVRGGNIKQSFGTNVAEETVMDTEEAVRRFLTYRAIDSSVWDKLYKRSCVQKVRFPLGYICEDVPFVYEVLANSARVVHCAKPLYYWLHRIGSTSRSAFSPKSMGLWYWFAEVRDACHKRFPQLSEEADYLFYKNLLVLALRVAAAGGIVEERTMVNGQVRKNIGAILSDRYLKRSYKLFAIAVFLGVERMAVKLLGPQFT